MPRPKRALLTCAWAVERALAEGSSFSQSGRSWLLDQQIKLRREQEENDQRLQGFDKQHGLLSVPLDDQIELLRNSVKELQAARVREQRGLGAQIEARTDELVRLAVLRDERRRMAGAAVSAQAILMVIEERLATQDLNHVLAPPLRKVDACAPCEAPSSAR